MSITELKTKSSYQLICLNCDTKYHDEYQLRCTENGCNALLRTNYPDAELELEEFEGLFRFLNWLPVEGALPTKAGPITYHAKELGERLGLTNLFISFNGYWPEKDAHTVACSFKAYEAYPTLQRMRERRQGALQVSSAGNTARAFAIASSETNEKVVLAVPTHSLDRVWTILENHDNILLFAIEGDYFDAITFGRAVVARYDNLLPEGGARNVARRDGMGLTMLDAAVEIGSIPDYYFQGIGSGTGGIAAYEMAKKLIADGNYGDDLPKFYLSQNDPFIPMVNAWRAGRREIIPDIDMPEAKESIERVYAKLLTNRVPPYSLKGGVYDVLAASDGDMISVTNEQAIAAFKLFEDVENIDLDPSAAVAFASLIKRTEEGKIDQDAKILLNISGGGYERVMKDHVVKYVKPILTIKQNDFSIVSEEVDQILSDFLN